jgi:release factor glutamine methyltransferase
VSDSLEPKSATWTILAALTWTTRRFTEAGLSTPRLDAELLLATATGLDRVGLYTGHDRPLDAAERGRYRELVRRRLQREPVAYLVGCKEFFSLALEVDARVLIPRAETEQVVEQALTALSPRGAVSDRETIEEGAGGRRPTVVDVGTGSGAIALAVQRQRPDLRVVATDLSADALDVARQNAERLRLPIELRRGDLLSALGGETAVELIVSNPPYIATAELASLPAEVRFEPAIALDGGSRGLEVITRLAREAADALAPGGWLILEIGHQQGPAALEVCQRLGAFEPARVTRDLAGLDRVVAARRLR